MKHNLELEPGHIIDDSSKLYVLKTLMLTFHYANATIYKYNDWKERSKQKGQGLN